MAWITIVHSLLGKGERGGGRGGKTGKGEGGGGWKGKK
jgi:hypothetical protein